MTERSNCVKFCKPTHAQSISSSETLRCPKGCNIVTLKLEAVFSLETCVSTRNQHCLIIQNTTIWNGPNYWELIISKLFPNR